MSNKEYANIEDAVSEAWSALDIEPSASSPELICQNTQSIQAFAPTTSLEEDTPNPRRPGAAHLRSHEQHDESLIITVGDHYSRKPRRPAFDAALSSLSSGLSVNQVSVPKPVRHASRHYPPGNYKCIATTFTPLRESTETVDEKKSAEETTTYELVPLESFGQKIASAGQLAALTTAHPLPAFTGSKWIREARYKIGSAYRRLWALAIITNIAVIGAMISRAQHDPTAFTYGQAATATGANLLVAALMRHEHCVNLLFSMACALPLSTPLCIRRQAAKVHCYGGVHSGCGISAFLWYILYAALAIQHFGGSPAASTALSATITLTLMLFTIIVSLSHPFIRMRWHNEWEISHRFSGWIAIALVWAQTLIIALSQASSIELSNSAILAKTPTFWFLIVITLCLLYPWFRLRRRKIESEKLSSHAVRLHFNDKSLPTCKGYRLARKPLFENHGFATLPNSDGAKGYSIVVSNAGDWTKNMINNPPSHIWTRGAPTTGVMRIATLFAPIVVVATGSGIGPCLSFLQVHLEWPMRVIWSARFPEVTYGKHIMRAVVRADEKAIIIDTKRTGHPDLPALTWALMKEIEAQAVVVISNPVVTKNLVSEMEARGVAAFGPVFDS